MSDGRRAEILGGVREAWRAPAPHSHGGANRHPSHLVQTEQTPREWLPVVPSDAESRLSLFREKCTQLKTDFRAVAGPEEAVAALAALRDRHGWTVLGAHHHPLIEPLLPALGLEVL